MMKMKTDLVLFSYDILLYGTLTVCTDIFIAPLLNCNNQIFSKTLPSYGVHIILFLNDKNWLCFIVFFLS